MTGEKSPDVDGADDLEEFLLDRYATRAGHGITLQELDLASLEDLFASLDDEVASLFELPEKEPPDREFEFIGDAPAGRDSRPEDPNGAYLTRCAVTADDIDLCDGRTDTRPRADTTPLDGVRVAVKDNIAVAGVPMTCGSPLLRSYLPPSDATVVERVVAAGASVVGKTSLNEFAYGGGPETMRFVLPRNPHDPERVPGGSSAGSAIAVAEGRADVALGSDTAASIRCPAAFCGIVGVKPSRGVVPHRGFVQFAKTLDAVGPLARTVEEASAALAVIAGEDSVDEDTRNIDSEAYIHAVERGAEEGVEGMTLGIPEQMCDLDAPVARTFDAARDRLVSAGASIQDVSIPNFELAMPAWIAIAFTEFGAYLHADAANYWSDCDESRPLSRALYRARRSENDAFNDTLREAILYAEHLREAHGGALYARAHEARRRVSEGFESVFSEVDALVAPTMPMLPGRWADGENDDGERGLIESVQNTAPCNLAGIPAVTVPAGTARPEGSNAESKLPVGLQFIGARFNEATVLRAAAGWEAVAREQWPTPPSGT